MTAYDKKKTQEFLGAWPHAIITTQKELAGDEPEVRESFGFTDKESYLAWVREWKMLLKEIESEIKMHKKARKGDVSGMHQMFASMLRQHAHAMLIRRRLGKKVSSQMRKERMLEAA